MPSLIPDILFDVGKEIVEGGNQEDIFKFAVSGKEQLKATQKVFASVTILKLYQDYYTVGWGNKFCTFGIHYGKPHSKYFMEQIGNCVLDLHIDCVVPKYYKSIIEKILAKKQLVQFSAGKDCSRKFLDRFLPKFSESLKNVAIPCYKTSKTFRDSFNLDSLTLSFSLERNCTRFCCKTETLEIYSTSAFGCITKEIKTVSPNLSSIKNLIVHRKTYWINGRELEGISKHFLGLDILKFNFTFDKSHVQLYQFFLDIAAKNLINFFTRSTKLPSKAVFSFNKIKISAPSSYPSLEFYKETCRDFEFDDSTVDYYCFRKTFQSTGAASSILEIHYYQS